MVLIKKDHEAPGIFYIGLKLVFAAGLMKLLSITLIAQDLGNNITADQYAIDSEMQGNRFAVQIPFTRKAVQSLQNQTEIFQDRVVYVPDQETDASSNIVFRVGFFASEDQVMELLAGWPLSIIPLQITQVSSEEHSSVINQLSNDTALLEEAGPVVLFLSTGTDFLQQLSSAQFLAKARNLYDQKKFQQAALQYQLLSLMADDATAAWGKELMGLSLEKAGKPDLAVKAYSEVLSDYPDAAGVARVEQRLMGLQTAANELQPALRRAASGTGSKQIYTRGVVGQYYRTLSRGINGDGKEEVMSLLSTDFDLRTSIRWSGHDLQARINGYAIRDGLDGDKSKLRLKRVNVEYQHLRSGASIKIGRQKDFDSGVFTSFDGLTASYPLLEKVEVSVSAGKPIYFSDLHDEIDYSFYAASLNWKLNEAWRLTSYYNSQTLNGVTDREALGWRAQFIGERMTTSLNIDYDIAFAELNNLMWNATFRVNDRASVSAIVGKQHSPFLTASNILIGQSDLNLNIYLQSKDNTDSLLDDALARTSLSQYYSISLNAALTEKTNLLASYYSSELTDIPSASFLLGQDVIDDTRMEFSQQIYSTQLIRRGLFHKSESTAVGFRRNSGSHSVSNQFFINERIRFGSRLTIAPKLSFSNIQFSTSSESQDQLRYSIAITYKPSGGTELNLEIGNESIANEIRESDFDSTYIFVGYRLIF